jgi:hypothetical protein
MVRRWVPFAVVLLGVASAACSGETMLPDTRLRAPGGTLHDGGFGLGSGGFTSAASGNDADAAAGTSSTTTTCLSSGGFGLGSGGKEDPCATAPTS